MATGMLWPPRLHGLSPLSLWAAEAEMRTALVNAGAAWSFVRVLVARHAMPYIMAYSSAIDASIGEHNEELRHLL
jgi:hypothetical protein